MPFEEAKLDPESLKAFIQFIGFKNIWCVTHGCRIMDHMSEHSRAYLEGNKFKEFILEAEKELAERNDCFYLEKPYEDLKAKGV